ncbi:MAG TPA: DUF2884 family protein [Luteimonas sp.]|nr:DUF2884 family protein [Luteimonas sp.]
MRNWMLVGALLLACGSAAAADVDVDCDVHSDYDFALTQKSLILTRKTGAPKTVLMRQGRLFIDDRWVAVDAADRERLAEYEKKARETMPLAAQIGRDAATIAFTALGEVAKGFSRDPERTEARLREAREELDRSLARSVSPTHFNSADLGKGIGDAVGDAVPLLVGDIVGGALRAAFTGDTERLEELDNLDSRIDAIVEPRAKALERNAETLCRSMRALDAIDDALDYRHDGKPLELLRVEAGHRSRFAD